MLPLIGLLIPMLDKVLDKVIPDPAAREAAKLELLKAQADDKLKEIEVQLSAIIAEAQSNDPWTSRARPSFLYVVYTIILAALPMGLLAAYDPQVAANVALGFKEWLSAIPEEMWWLFGTGYLGYTGARTVEKKKLIGK